MNTTALLALLGLSSIATASFDNYPDRLSLLRALRGDTFSFSYRSPAGSYTSSPYTRSVNSWNIDISTTLGGPNALFIANNGIGAASTLHPTFVTPVNRTATAAAMKIFVVNSQLNPIAGQVTVQADNNVDSYTLQVPIE